MLHARPKRRETTHVETLQGELCIYEWTTTTVHALNPAAARVWELCDGSTTIDEMIAAVRRDLQAPGARSIVEHALTQFDRAGLLERGTLAGIGPLLSRRALLRRIGAAAAIPVVTSIVAPTPLAAQSGLGNTMTFNATFAPQSFIVPAGITSLHVDVAGASGGAQVGPPNQAAGHGGRVTAILPVTPLETLTIMVGGAGGQGTAGFNGGGAGGAGPIGAFGGGGRSDIHRGSTLLIVAGGGAGGSQLASGNGGHGGGLVGGMGTALCGATGGQGGTPSAGGAGGTSDSGGTTGSPGAAGTGGQGGPAPSGDFFGGSGGGGGYFGGGGGGVCTGNRPGAGGGGSSFTDPSATSVVHTQGFRSGNGVIIVSW